MRRFLAIGALGLLLVVAAVPYSMLGRVRGPEPLTAVVLKGDFPRFVRATGSVFATNSIRINNPLDWRAISYVATEGSQVKKGEVILELERDDLEEEVLEDTNSYRVKVAKLKESEQTLAAEKQRIESSIATAIARLAIAKLELENLLKTPRPDDVRRAEIELRRAKAVLAVAKAEYERSQRYDARALMLASELRSIERNYLKAIKDHDLAEKTLTILNMGPEATPEALARARLNVQQAESELGSAKKELPEKMHQLTSAIERARIDVEQRKIRLDRAKKDLDATTIRAEVDGMIVYQAIHGRKLARGDKAWKGAGLIDLPELASMSIKARVRESDVRDISVGRACRIFIDAIPNKLFTGKVTEISTMAQDSSISEKMTVGDMRRDTGIKVFDVTISIDSGNELLRPNLMARAEIMIETIPDALSIPLDAVYEHEGGKCVYLRSGARPSQVAVELGSTQDDRVVVHSGLEAGQEVYIVLPPERGLAAGIRALGQRIKSWLTPAPPATEEPNGDKAPDGRPGRPDKPKLGPQGHERG
jgi:HlyD family secretion protein